MQITWLESSNNVQKPQPDNTNKQHSRRKHCKKVFLGLKKWGVCFIINVQCTLDNCAVSFFFPGLFCCNTASEQSLIQIEDERDFTPWAKVENEDCLVKKNQRGRKKKEKAARQVHRLWFLLCCSAAASP